MRFIPTNSIRLRLAAALFLGFIVLLSLASVSIYFVSKRILEEDFNARLFAKAQAAVASISQKGSWLDVDWTELPQELNPQKHSQDAIQLIDGDGHPVLKDSPVVASPTASTQGIYQDLVLPELGHARILSLSFLPHVERKDLAVTPPELRKNCVLAVASSRRSLDHSLHKLVVILALMTGVTSLLSLALVWLVVKQGLRPLDRLGSAMARVEVESLGQQISLNDLPEELTPIADKLNDLLRRLDVSFARERRFSADVSHELRTPVAELKTLSEVMLQDEKHSPEVQRAFEDARDIAGQMEALVTVLLEMVRQEAGCTPLALSDVDLESQAQLALKKYEAKAAQRDLRLRMLPPKKAITLNTEPRLLAMVLANLLDNAIEYSPAGSVVDLEFQSEKEFPYLIISNPAEKLAPADLPHVFERFWRKDSARGESNHFGIGLSLTQALCQRLGIRLTVSMDKGNVIRFWLYFSTKETTPLL